MMTYNEINSSINEQLEKEVSYWRSIALELRREFEMERQIKESYCREAEELRRKLAQGDWSCINA